MLDPPKQVKTDAALTLVEGGLGAIPVVGSLAQAVFKLCVVPPFQKRVQSFFEDVAITLQRHGVAIENLGNDERFHAAAMQAAILAGRTRDEGKRAALRNAVLNVVKRTSDDAHEDVFLAWMEILSPTHLALMDVLDSPPAWFAKANRPWPATNSIAATLRVATGLGDDIIVPVYGDLYARGLVNTQSCTTMMSAEGPKAVRTTQIGRRFIEFLREPSPPAA